MRGNKSCRPTCLARPARLVGRDLKFRSSDVKQAYANLTIDYPVPWRRRERKPVRCVVLLVMGAVDMAAWAFSC